MADRATRLVVPESTVPGTRAWAETVAANARQYAGFTEKDVRPLVERYRQLCDREAWELWYPGQLEARERFFRDVLGYEAEFLDMMDKGVEILDACGHQGPVPRRQAELAVAERAAAMPEPGKIHKGNSPVVTPNNMRSTDDGKYGTHAEYLTRRIARDRPDILARMKAGEFRSIRAAAVEAGMAPRTQTVRIDKPDSVARTLLKYMSADDIAKLIAFLGEAG